ncbi:hypothetical protein ASPZODRAFT_134415 [Penicilliopsis zonata CBS 506.65]|uniref:Uncharacterized protein n=1 Tax=Penicilliopsis zonata CBS 506.65 TaxID=1073090 RepID=A0A1L9SCZ3_9EURO|nr:hypothetical protein ASPZODRAFT_134415 [Penicilliopsis zonata CBS 506.65]OJJ44992.1 hypothetical protein ASPZODRAFT_134415 [Penicilliopsis zonata CBS 506.65]
MVVTLKPTNSQRWLRCDLQQRFGGRTKIVASLKANHGPRRETRRASRSRQEHFLGSVHPQHSLASRCQATKENKRREERTQEQERQEREGKGNVTGGRRSRSSSTSGQIAHRTIELTEPLRSRSCAPPALTCMNYSSLAVLSQFSDEVGGPRLAAPLAEASLMAACGMFHDDGSGTQDFLGRHVFVEKKKEKKRKSPL